MVRTTLVWTDMVWTDMVWTDTVWTDTVRTVLVQNAMVRADTDGVVDVGPGLAGTSGGNSFGPVEGRLVVWGGSGWLDSGGAARAVVVAGRG